MNKFILAAVAALTLTTNVNAEPFWSDKELTHEVTINGKVEGYQTTRQVENGIMVYYRVLRSDSKHYTTSTIDGSVDTNHLDTIIKIYNVDGSYMNASMYEAWEKNQALIEQALFDAECAKDHSFYELYDNWIKC